jgi:hypothetical protein
MAKLNLTAITVALGLAAAIETLTMSCLVEYCVNGHESGAI